MNRYLEAVLVGIAAAVIAGLVGVRAHFPTASAATLESAAPGPASAAAVAPNVTAVRASVSGRVTSINFTAEQAVKQGEVLISIDPLPFQKAYDKAQADLGRARWRYLIAVADRTRALDHVASKGGSREEFDSRSAAAEQAGAAVKAAEGVLIEARRNLDSTSVTAPVTGVVGHAEVTVGSLVTSGQTRLTTVAPVAPIDMARN